MTSRVHLLTQHLPVSRLTIDVLFALRLLYDETEPDQDIGKDIAELADFPERLQGSYRAEWEAFVKRALAKQLSNNQHRPAMEVIDDIMTQVHHIHTQDPRFLSLMPNITQAQKIIASDNTSVFPSPLRKQLTGLLLPAITLPSDK
ncbi:hypothetical protein OCL06_02555 [Alteromonas sp. ASW11-19]|uniref:Uncharacterized protein n=1 Tax=Alteromonas salexigens TaxID=2982530 RepID=A0ABT2VJS5_9ALTE|nr:hypothetical protein [Alteromonas salexigens]MCU7553476.1 hypothetical protein [Alteromonas salexigens]